MCISYFFCCSEHDLFVIRRKKGLEELHLGERPDGSPKTSSARSVVNHDSISRIRCFLGPVDEERVRAEHRGKVIAHINYQSGC